MRDPGALHVAELRRLVDLAVAVLVAHRHQAVAAGEIDVAVGRDREVPAAPRPSCTTVAVKPGGNRQAVVVGGHGDAAAAS